MKKIATAVAALLLAATLTGCVYGQEDCEADGGDWVFTGTVIMITTQYVQSGSTQIPITSQYPMDTYECQGVE